MPPERMKIAAVELSLSSIGPIGHGHVTYSDTSERSLRNLRRARRENGSAEVRTRIDRQNEAKYMRARCADQGSASVFPFQI